ncbi:MAG: hypothetical protein H7222_04545 [Methylotenera sp.]|nr:hypothetical protein [Oligoflexia bacterium]
MNDWPKYQVRVPGKWVLAGEHTVLRGGGAVALPHPDFFLSAEFMPGRTGKLVITPPPAVQVIEELLHAVQDQVQTFSLPEGNFRLESTIPLGAGLGSSAALCVAITRWLAEPLQIPKAEQFEFARSLEHRFHGQSSGMDIAVALAGEPIAFSMDGGGRPLGIKRLPRFTFHDTGVRARTSDCVRKVRELRESSPVLAMKIDELMSQAARDCTEGLIRFDSCMNDSEALEILARGLTHGQEAFAHWQLVPEGTENLIEQLRNQGALAAKLTGSGGGGYVVALWR